MNAQSDQAKAIFLEALEKPTPAERSAFLDSACAADAALRQRVETLLRAHRPDDSFLDPGKLHPQHTPSGHTQTSDFSDTSTVNKSSQPSGKLLPELAQYFGPPQQPDSLGRFLHYEVLELLGQGGCGIVYRVFDTKLHRMVALKIMSPTLASHPASRLRFLREARTAAAVRHEHVISIHAVDETPLPHLIMEYISGPSLQQKIDKTGSLTTKEILRIGYQIALGLEAAHKQGLIHRDIKPANILLENGIERVKITDFGLARAIDDTNISHQGLIVGTPSYMSPEQAEGQPVDARSDLFSLGSTMYAMCAGQSPFQGSSTLTVLKRVVEDKPRSLKEANPETPDWLEAVIMKLLAKKPEERYQDASAVTSDLGKYLAELQSKGTVQQVAPPKSRLRRVLAVLTLIGLSLLLLAFLEKRGLTNIATPILKLFYHEITLHLPDRDTIVEVWKTTDTDEHSKSTTLTSSWPFVPAATIVSDTLHKLPLPPGRYWLLARRHGKRIDRRLLTIGWGGSSSINLTSTTSSGDNAGTASTEPRLLKAFDPKVDKFSPAPWGDPQKTVFVEDGAWKLENNTEGGNFDFILGPMLDNIPTDGIIICKAKLKLKKQHKDCWGELLLNRLSPGDFGIDWPVQLYKYYSDIPEWTQMEVRYSAHAFHQKNPPQLSIHLGLHANGILWVKDLQLLHEPAKPTQNVSDKPTPRQPQSTVAYATSGASSQKEAAKPGPRLLKRFDPKVEKPEPAPWADPAKTIFVEDGGWRVENHLEAGMFYFAFSPLLENLPTDGVVICRAKIKLKKKSNPGWGQLLLNAEQPDLAGYDWPKDRYQIESDLDQWTSKEVRYPAKVFFQRNPPQISVFFSFHITGTIWIKDLELLHLPGPVPASTSRVPELVKLVELADQQMKTVNEQYQAGLVSYDAWLKTKVNWLNHCITLAEERKLRDEAIKYLVQLKDTQDKQLQFAKQLIHVGRIKESDALPIQEEIVKTELRLKQAKEKK